MISRMVGFGLIVGVSGWLGLQKANHLSVRTRSLRQLRMDLAFLENEIGYVRNPLELALRKTARVSAVPVSQLFLEASRTLAKNPALTAREAWESGVESLVGKGGLSGEDLAVIALIGERLGVSDVEDQLRMLRQAGAELKVQEEKSRQREQSEKKLWSYGGFLFGLMISILMI